MKNIILLVLCLLLTNTALAQNDETSTRIGVKVSKPFVFKEDGQYSGIAIDLWELSNPDEQNIEYVEFTTVKGLLEAVNNGDVQAGVAPITITSDREKVVNFSTTFFNSGVGIAQREQSESVLAVLVSIIPNLLSALFVLFLIMLVAGLIFWVLEHNKNDDVRSRFASVFTGLYWASATTTTVGYGDISAKTRLGRLFSVVWMWISIFLMSTITASIIASVQLNTSNLEINLYDSTIGVLEGSRAESIALSRELEYYTYPSLEAMFDALTAKDIDGIMHDIPILAYYLKDNGIRDIVIGDSSVADEYYGFALNQEYENIESLNQNILKNLESQRWKRILTNY